MPPPRIRSGVKPAIQNLPGVNVPCTTGRLDRGMDATSSNSSLFGMGEGQSLQMRGSVGIGNVASSYSMVNSTSPFGTSLWSAPAPSDPPSSSGDQW